jgi:transcriptional regulator with GAF, ATPase, and Fis domain
MTRQTRLAEVFVELADTLVEQFDVIEFLQMLTERSVELLEADAAGLMLADERGSLQLMASTAEKMRVLELFELQIQEGPCYDCWRTGQPVSNVALAAALDRWPSFTAAALEAGYGSTHALPMRLRGHVIGALNLFNAAEQPLGADDLALGQAMADVATIGLLHERTLQEQTTLSEQLQTALQSRVLIEQAKGVLSARAGLSIGEAFVRMRSHARRNGVGLTDVAQAVVDGQIDQQVLAPSRT